MSRIDFTSASASVPQPRANAAPTVAASTSASATAVGTTPVARSRPVAGSSPVAASAALRGDRIAGPVAAPTPDPNGVCPVPDPQRDRQQLVQGLTIGATIAAGIAAPEIVAASGLDDLASAATASALRGASGVARTAGKIASSAADQFAEDAAATARNLKDAEAFGKALGHQAHNTLTTLGQSLVQGAVGAGLGAWAVSALRSHAPAAPASSGSASPSPSASPGSATPSPSVAAAHRSRPALPEVFARPVGDR